MRKMIPIVQCDHCKNEVAADVKSAIVDLALPGQKAVRYSGENCVDCESKLAQALLELLGEYLVEERKPSTKVKPAGDSRPGPAKGTNVNAPRVTEYDENGWSIEARTCPRCGHVSVSRSGIGQHLSSRHSTTLAEEGMLETTAQRAARFARIGRVEQ